ncbi:MAG: NAD(P)H-dependent oxidoreductase subunit E [Eubacteriales bacterium]|nr:NAD(P)H-dependent oxidoreductase subunit E [Eubacteriales bacterium]
MEWNLGETLDYYRRQGAPGDQNALIALLKEIQRENGCIPADTPAKIAEYYEIREPLVLALIRRVPSLRLSGGHCMELCAGPNCGKSAFLADFAEKTAPKNVTVKRVGCMRLCGKGPNLRWDGKLYNRADKALIQRLMEQK